MSTSKAGSERRVGTPLPPGLDLLDLVEGLDAAVYVADPATCRIVYISRRVEAILGYPAARWLEEGFWSGTLHPEDREEAVRTCQQSTAASLDHSFEYRAHHADGRPRWIRNVVRVVRGPDGRAERLFGMFLDVTEEKTTAKERDDASSLLRATLDSTADGILVVDRRGAIVSLNSKFSEMWRIPEEVLRARDDERALSFVLDQLKDPEGFLSKVRELYARPEESCFDVLEFKDGRVFERYSRPQRVGGECVGRVWSFRDITERRRVEEALRESEERLRFAQKMEAVGRLAGGVAHDFNNLLTAIRGYCEMLIERLGPSHPGVGEAREIGKASDRAAALTRQLLAFSRKQVLQPKVINLNTTVAEMERMLRPLIGEDVELVLLRDPALGQVRADPGQIEQVLMNLAANGRDAMPRGGRLFIETRNVELDADYAARHVSVRPGAYALLSVTDTGAGMDAATRARIFDPFFTTKETGKGTGLGLATVYGICKQSGGNIWVYSEPGIGSTFKIYLPLVDQPADALSAPPRLPEPRPGSETILLVEDEEMVRTLVGEVLRQRGYTVIEASLPKDAISLAGAHQGPIHLLLADVVMPQMSGRDVARALVDLRESLRVLFMSGYAEPAVLHHGLLDSGTAFIQKPFTPDELVRKVRSVIDSP